MIQAVRGMNDIIPPDTHLWRHIERVFRNIAHSYGYQEIRLPIVEKTELFKRTIGENTDIVEKEMYTFKDKQDESLTLRPEGTAGCVRAAIEQGHLYRQVQKLWYVGPFFRRERPQRGRYRQFHQCGAEVFGLAGPDIDAELILFSARVLGKLGLKKDLTLQLNSLGSKESRANYRKELLRYFSKHKSELDEDSLRRLADNPLRILDSKNPELKDLIAKAPILLDYLDTDSKTHFRRLREYLDFTGLNYEVNTHLVRGLDYYTRTVFEWVTTKLGAQGTVCAGGRYDGLIEQLGGKPTPALGFAMGLERTVLLMQQQNHEHASGTIMHAYFITDGEEAFQVALRLTDKLRDQVAGIRIILHCGSGNLSNQFKKADKSGAHYAIVLGENELKTHTLTIKPLRNKLPQQTIHQLEIAEYLKLKIREIMEKKQK
ncbi:MAG TPA: histidine--tRNA ligase [Gammaproteobacteria bacterium]|nr:histidine--tRNA ligase [Gammaproteobacteria bacterium]